MATQKQKTTKGTSSKKTPVKKASVRKVPRKKISAKKTSAKKEPSEKVTKVGPYYEAVGRRKRSTARVRLFTCRPFEDKKGKIIVNEKNYTNFFPIFELQETIISPLKKMKSLNRFEATVKVKGGGIRGQAEAIRHGLARALIKFNPDFSKKLKRAGYLRRDPRKKERKKPGLKKARRAPQWKKR